MTKNIMIVGVGGQGTLLTSRIIGKAALEMGYDVKISEVHGMAQRGGSVLSTLRFGEDISSPLEAVGNADLIMGFEPVETVRNLGLANKDSVILMNLDPVLPSLVAAGFEEYPEIQSLIDTIAAVNDNVRTIEATNLALQAGKAVAANAVMIGAVAAMEGFPLSKDQLLDALKANVPPKFLDLNIRAFELGYANFKN